MNAVRSICWLLCVASVMLVIACYGSLPNEFPVSRWTTAPKTLFLAVRVPLINLASLALIELLTANLRRAAPIVSGAERNFYFCLLATVAAKSVIETIEIVYLANFETPLCKYGLMVVVAAGLSAAAYYFTRVESARKQAICQTTRSTNILIGLLLMAIVVLNLPLVATQW
jgi:hypothetical protein